MRNDISLYLALVSVSGQKGRLLARGQHLGHGLALVFQTQADLRTPVIDHLCVPKNLAALVETAHLKGQWTCRLSV